jgi:antitoxin (DNA-binding transcriptional repressor) of toxin-antitoxin stability system
MARPVARKLSRNRLLAARDVLSLLRRDPSFRDSVVANTSGERPILVASVEDHLSELLERVRRIGLPVTLYVRGGTATKTVVTIRTAETDEHPQSEAIRPDITVGVFIAHMWEKGGSMSFHVAAPSPTRPVSRPRATEFELEFA